MVRATEGHSTGKRCFELEYAATDASASIIVGIASASASLTSYPGGTPVSAGAQFIATAAQQPFRSGLTAVSPFSVGTTATAGDVVTICIDFASGKAWWAMNGVWTSGNPAAGTAPNVTGISGEIFPAAGTYNAANAIRLRSANLDHLPQGFAPWSDVGTKWQKVTAYFRHSSSYLIEPIDVRSTMRVVDAVTADQVRADVIDFIWPQGRPSGQSFTVASNPLNVVGAASAEKWTLTMQHGIVSRMFFLDAAANGDCLFIWHDGHDALAVTGNAAVLDIAKAMLADGCDVLLISMPLHGVNAQSLTLHDQLAQYDSPSFSSMMFFLEPVMKAIDEATSRRNYAKIGMSGLSGGGWTTTVAGAIDDRITALYPIAGSMPFELDIDPSLTGGVEVSSKRGDHEQSLAPFYAIASYLDIYALGAINRRAMHFYIANDNCCFPAWAAQAFAPALSLIVQTELSGTLIFRQDTVATSHELSAWARSVILADFQRL